MLESLHLGSWLRLLRPGSPWLAPFVPTPHEVASQLLKLGRLAPGETVCDLGCGDGRLLSLAVRKFGARRAIGYELDESLVAAARSDAAGDPRIDVRLGDASSAAEALAESDIVTLYLSVSGNATLLPLLRQHLRPHARVCSYVWEMPSVEPTKTLLMPGSGVPLHLFEHAALHENAPPAPPDS